MTWDEDKNRFVAIPDKYLKCIGIGFLVAAFGIAGVWDLLHYPVFVPAGMTLADAIVTALIALATWIYGVLVGKNARRLGEVS